MAKSEQQREHILDVARDLFAQNGYEATTTRQLNKAVGIADGLMYYYFPHGKQEILDTIVRQGIASGEGEVQLDMTDVTTRAEVEDRLLAFIQQVWELFTREDNYQSFMITIRERMLLTDAESSWLHNITMAIETNIEKALLAVQNVLDCQPEDAPQMASLIIAIMERTLYDELLIRSNRVLASDQLKQLRSEVHFLLNK